MTQLIHNSPLGALEIPGVIGRPEPGEPFDIDDDLAEGLLVQSDLYSLATPEEPDTRTIPELRDIAESQGVDITGLRKKADIIAALEAAPAIPVTIDTDASDDDPDDTNTADADSQGDDQ